jgi:hypothetical protein
MPTTAAGLSAITGPFGLLPLGLGLAGLLAWTLGRWVAPDGGRHERWLAGTTLTIAFVVVATRLLAAVGLLGPVPLLGLGALLLALAFRLGRARAVAAPPRALGELVDGATGPALAVGLAAAAIAAVVAALLPVWQWDALGYHLPFVNHLLERGRWSDVPHDVPYLGTYPHNVDLVFAAWRALLPDDRLVDAAQVPFGLVGALAAAALARHAGAGRREALAAGALWLAAPACFLQMPTNYVDVACAALLLLASAFLAAPARARTLLLAAVAIGLFLGAKPSAPVPAAILCLVLGLRALGAGQRRVLVPAVLVVAALGLEVYLRNVIVHGNPVWPVIVKLGPWKLPGLYDVSVLLGSGADVARLSGPTPIRLVKSWLAVGAPPIFDMRYGGFGLPFLVALPAAVAAAIARRSWVLSAILVAAVAAPDPSVARYTLALPAVALALAAAPWSRAEGWARVAIGLLAAVGGAVGIAQAWAGLAGREEALSTVVARSPEERLRTLGADGPPRGLVDARERLLPGEGAAYDHECELPGLLWRSDLANRVVRLGPEVVDAAAAARLVTAHRVKLLHTHPKGAGGRLVAAEPERWISVYHSKSDGCVAYSRQ